MIVKPEPPALVTIPTNSRPPEDLQRTSYRIVRAPPQGELTGLSLSPGHPRRHDPLSHGPHTAAHRTLLPPVRRRPSPKVARLSGPVAHTKPRSLPPRIHGRPDRPAARIHRPPRNTTRSPAHLLPHGKQTNGRVCIRVARGDLDMFAAPAAPDVQAILNRIWQVDRLIAQESQRNAEAVQAQQIKARGDHHYTAETKKEKS
jgi:hypothetical protein